MISKLKANKSLRKRGGYFQLKEELRKASKKESIELKQASPAQMKTIRSRMLLERKQAVRKEVLAVILALLTGSVCFFFLALLLMYFFF